MNNRANGHEGADEELEYTNDTVKHSGDRASPDELPENQIHLLFRLSGLISNQADNIWNSSER